MSWRSSTYPLEHPTRSLGLVFLSWKILLLAIALSSPGPGYDTSTTLFTAQATITDSHVASSFLHAIVNKLTRWDAIYFVHAAHHGYVFEQEWAFSWALTRLISFLSRLIAPSHPDVAVEAAIGIAVAHLAHGLSVLALYQLTLELFSSTKGKKIAFISACLSIFSPAGLFLSAPYAESAFAALNFLGTLFVVRGWPPSSTASWRQDVYIMSAGLFFGVATMIRSNGILNGIVFLELAIQALRSLLSEIQAVRLRHLIAVVIAGIFTGSGLILPQLVAYQQYCSRTAMVEMGQPRAWCLSMVPSIYSFVQEHYWNVGFLRYWVIPNVPLFLLAAPMILVLTYSAVNYIFVDISRIPFSLVGRSTKAEAANGVVKDTHRARILRVLAVPQLLLAVMAVTNYHVQIITRISSGYPVWYVWLASCMTGEMSALPNDTPNFLKNRSMLVVRFMVMYAVIQGGLFASFLPPA